MLWRRQGNNRQKQEGEEHGYVEVSFRKAAYWLRVTCRSDIPAWTVQRVKVTTVVVQDLALFPFAGTSGLIAADEEKLHHSSLPMPSGKIWKCGRVEYVCNCLSEWWKRASIYHVPSSRRKLRRTGIWNVDITMIIADEIILESWISDERIWW